MNLNDWASWATIVGGIGVLLTAVRWFLIRLLKPIKNELQRNGGSSMRDEVSQIKTLLVDHLISSAAKTAEQDVRIKHVEKALERL